MMIFASFVFQSWAKDSDARTSIENTLTYAYYSKLFSLHTHQYHFDFTF